MSEIARPYEEWSLKSQSAALVAEEWSLKSQSAALLTSLPTPCQGTCCSDLKAGSVTWTDGEATTKICSFCGVVVHLAILTNNVELREFVSKDLFSAVIRGLAMKSNAVNGADLVNLCREIFIYLSDRDSAPRQVLLSLRCLTPNDLRAFEEAVGKTPSPKEQKQLMRSFVAVRYREQVKSSLAAQENMIMSSLTSL
ncbi:Protein HASTY 1 [Raphanus sativus]|nr:Protein HASTY 1 [Raphanus sativus]